jgi:hypothetical protein
MSLKYILFLATCCTRNTKSVQGTHNQGSGTEMPQYEDKKSTHSEIENSDDMHQRVLLTKQVQCSRFHQSVLPEDGPVWPKHVAKIGYE